MKSDDYKGLNVKSNPSNAGVIVIDICVLKNARPRINYRFVPDRFS